jgi:hypothetical protein
MKRPQEWEYKVEPVFRPGLTNDILNSFAEEGWRLVAVTHPDPDGQFRDPAGPSTARGPWLFLERRVLPDVADSDDPGD